MRCLCVVPCGKTKIWDKNPGLGPVAARAVYIGPFAKKCREYAETFYPSSWCILSAKYGFVRPEEIIPGPYNVSFNDPKTNPIDVRTLALQVLEKGLNDFDQVIVLGGRNYRMIVEAVFTDKRILTPLASCRGIGYMMSEMKSAVQMGKPL